MNQDKSHDRFVRRTLTSPRISVPLFKKRLPPEISQRLDFERLEQEPDDFIDAALHETQSDMLFSVPLLDWPATVYIYLLFEHKSTWRDEECFNMLRRTVLIMDQHRRRHPGEGLPLVLPMVLYHGKQPITGSLHVADLIDVPPEFEQFRPSSRLYLIDLSQKSDEELEDGTWAGIFQLVLKHVHDPEILPAILDLVPRMVQLHIQESGFDFLVEVLRYLMSAASTGDVGVVMEALSQQMPREVSEGMGSIAEYFIEHGEKRGEKKGMQKAALGMIAEGLDLETISRITEIPVEDLERLRIQRDD